MIIAFFYIALCFLAAYIASQKGRSGSNWFVISLIVSPVIGIIGVACVPNLLQQATAEGPYELAHPMQKEKLPWYKMSAWGPLMIIFGVIMFYGIWRIGVMG